MKIVCGSCGAKYSIADEKVQGKVFKIRCKKCSNVIVVKGDSQAEDSPAEQAHADSGMASAYGGTSAASEWYVVVDGEQVGPISPEEVEAYYVSGQVHDESFAWRDGLSDWVPLSQLDEFVHLSHMGGGSSDEATMLAQSPFAPEEAGGPAEQPAYDDDATSLMAASEFRAQLEEKEAQAAAAASGGFGASAETGAGYDSGGSFGGYDSGGSYGGYDSGADSNYESGGSYGGYESGGSYSGAGGEDAGYDSGGSYGGYDSGGSYSGDGGGYDSYGQEKPYGQEEPDNQGMFASFDSGADGGDSGFDAGFDAINQGQSAGADGGAASANDMIGQRNENSVLFSLSSLDQVKAVSSPSPGASTPAAGAAGGAPAGPAGTEGSGLIDIQALASAHKAMKGSGQAGGPGELPGLDSTFGAGTMSMPALMPMGSHRDNRPLIIGAVILGLLLLFGMAAVIFFLATKKDEPTPVPTEIVQQAPANNAQQAPPADQAASAEEAQAAAAAAKAVDEESEEAKEDEDDEALAKADEEKKDEKPAATKSRSRSSSSSSKPAASARPAATASSSKPAAKAPAKKSGDIFDLLDKKEDSKAASKPAAGKPASGGGGAAPAKNLPEKLTRPMVQSTVNKYNGRIHSCYTGSNRNKLGGTIMVNFSIQPNGRVKSAAVNTGQFKGTDVGKCVEGVVRSMKFPETKSPLTVNYPFMLK